MSTLDKVSAPHPFKLLEIVVLIPSPTSVVGLSKDLEIGHLEVDFILWALLPYFEKWQQSNCQVVCPERYTYNSSDRTHHALSLPATLAMEAKISND
jgi:hypothetical protein